MTSIAVFSDTHGNLELLRQAASAAKRYPVAKAYHLGDRYEDAEELETAGFRVLRVPGIFHPSYERREAPRKLKDHVGELEILMLHDEKDLTDEEVESAHIVLVGHTHRFEIRLDGEKALVNPGQLKEPLDKGRPPTFGLLEIEVNKCNIKILSPAGNLLAEATYTKPDADGIA